METDSSGNLNITQIPEDIKKKNIHSKAWLFTFVVFILVGAFTGIVISYKFSIPLSNNSFPTNISQITLPKNAVQIQSCASHKGILYVEPQNIPEGPLYMQYKGNVIGIEYMMDKASFSKEQLLPEPKYVRVDHIEMNNMPEGHEGYSEPHYHVDFYFINKQTENSIECPSASNQGMKM